jgi:hypothetical protein
MLSFGGVTVHPPATTKKNLYFRLTVATVSEIAIFNIAGSFPPYKVDFAHSRGKGVKGVQQITFFNFIIKKPNML